MNTINGIPIVWDTEGDNNLFGSLFPEGMNMSDVMSGNKFPQFPVNNNFTILSTKDIGNKYYENNAKYQQGGITVYADDDIDLEKQLEEVKVYENRFYKEFKDFTFVLFVSKNGARLLNQYKECTVSSNEIALFLEVNDSNNVFGSVMEMKHGDNINKVKLPIAEMLEFMRTKRVNLEDDDIIELLKGAYQSKGGILNWIGRIYTKVIGGITSFALSGVELLNQAFISFFDSLLIDEKHWNTEVKEYSAFFVPDNLLELINKKEDNKDKIIEAILLPVKSKLNDVEKAIESSLESIKPLFPSKIHKALEKSIKTIFQGVDVFLEYLEKEDFMNLLKTAFEVANAHLCGFINGIVDFFKGIFEIISLILNMISGLKDYTSDSFFYNSLLIEIFENMISMIVEFDFKKFMINAFFYPIKLLAKTINFVKNINLDLTSININLSKVGYITGYITGLIITIIIDALYTGGVKAVEDIIKALETFLKNPKAILKNGLQTAGRKSVAAIESVIDFMSSMANKIKKGGEKLLADFEKFVDDVFKWLEELLKGGKILKIGSGGFLKYEKIISRNMVKQEELNSCVAACIKQLANDNKIDLTEEAIRILAKTTDAGTDAPNTAKTLIKIFENQKTLELKMMYDPLISDINALKSVENNGSWITFIRPNATTKPHAVIVDKIIGKKVFLRDPWPLEGIDKVTFFKAEYGIVAEANFDEFVKQWAFGGNYVFKIK
jgi:hypothetical protein